ncbi:unnamed protein product [Orchesella dallaii]|uniref:Uncharacterized protein n=1 Tax=Orchesella dallaii TaxID=48710 RepID=A0ABP1PSK1_9HEXA
MNNSVKRPRISLVDAPVINLTQLSGSKRRSDCTTSNGDSRGGATASQKQDGGDAEDDRWSICPKSTDEPSYMAKLSTYSGLSYVEICGWSGLTPLRFLNIKDNFRFLELIRRDGSIDPAANGLMNHCIPLRDMEAFSRTQAVVSHPVFVQVVAKRKVDLFVGGNRQINIIPLIVIADKSGYCVLCCFNEGLSCLFNACDVGDFLLITRCMPQIPKRIYHRGLYAEEMFLNLELKVNFYSVKSYYIKRFSPLKVSQFKLSEKLFADEHLMKLPNELMNEFRSLNPVSPLEQAHYDVAGVISYVGRIERFTINEPLNAECLVDGATSIQTINRYIVFRWVHLVDKTSEPVAVKVLVNNITIPFQDILVPGALVVITNCTTSACLWMKPYCMASPFSQIYVCGNIEKYYMLHPPSFKAKTGEIMIRSNYCDIISRHEIPWSVGGTQSYRITSGVEFLKSFSNSKIHHIDDRFPLVRRESRHLFFEGMIWRVIEVYDEDFPVVFYIHKRYCEEKDKMVTDYKLLENFLPYNLYRNRSWYAFSRRLPPYDPIILQEQLTRNIVKKIVATYKKFCQPLLMPAVLKKDELPPVADLERLDGPPYLLIDIVDDKTKNWYRCIWKTQEYSHNEMLTKVTEAKDKMISCSAEVFCIETDAALEVKLLDFVTSGS